MDITCRICGILALGIADPHSQLCITDYKYRKAAGIFLILIGLLNRHAHTHIWWIFGAMPISTSPTWKYTCSRQLIFPALFCILTRLFFWVALAHKMNCHATTCMKRCDWVLCSMFTYFGQWWSILWATRGSTNQRFSLYQNALYLCIASCLIHITKANRFHSPLALCADNWKVLAFNPGVLERV